jgi:predicted GNAT family N-acyltransferase
MIIKKKKLEVSGVKFFVLEKNKEIARAYLYIIKNELHKQPFGLIEDVFVVDENKGAGLSSQLINEIMKFAEKKKCYKIIMTSRYSRPDLHKIYQDLGFNDYGKEFRIDLK